MVDRLETTPDKIESSEHSSFIGLDGKHYFDSRSLEQANRDWFSQNKRCISAVTGKEYAEYDDLQREERLYWEQQIIPEDKIIKDKEK